MAGRLADMANEMEMANIPNTRPPALPMGTRELEFYKHAAESSTNKFDIAESIVMPFLSSRPAAIYYCASFCQIKKFLLT